MNPFKNDPIPACSFGMEVFIAAWLIVLELPSRIKDEADDQNDVAQAVSGRTLITTRLDPLAVKP